MAIHKIKSEIDLELIRDCAIELVFVHPWVFGEVKRVQIPKGIEPTPSTAPTAYKGKNVGITENSKPSQSNETKECSVVLMTIKKPQDANVTLQSQQEQLTTRCTGRKRTVTDYKKLADYTEEDEVTAPVKWKKPTNLLRKPSRNQQKIERTRQKNKKNKAASEMSDSKSPASGNIGTFPPSTISDSISPDAQPIEVPNRTLITPTETEEKSPDMPIINNQASTSAGTSSTTNQTTILVPASKEETEVAIDALLSLGRDLNIGIDMEPDDNDLLQPIAPEKFLPNPSPMISEINSDDTEILEQPALPEEERQKTEAQTKKSEPNPVNKKGQLVVRNYKLARIHRPKRKFSCVGCPQKFVNNKELNDHFKNSHPPVTCSDCKKLFSTPSAFEKHKYTHYEYMY